MEANSESIDLAYYDSLDANSRTPGTVEQTQHASETPPQVSYTAESSQTTQHVTPTFNRKPNIPTKKKCATSKCHSSFNGIYHKKTKR